MRISPQRPDQHWVHVASAGDQRVEHPRSSRRLTKSRVPASPRTHIRTSSPASSKPGRSESRCRSEPPMPNTPSGRGGPCTVKRGTGVAGRRRIVAEPRTSWISGATSREIASIENRRRNSSAPTRATRFLPPGVILTGPLTSGRGGASVAGRAEPGRRPCIRESRAAGVSAVITGLAHASASNTLFGITRWVFSPCRRFRGRHRSARSTATARAADRRGREGPDVGVGRAIRQGLNLE